MLIKTLGTSHGDATISRFNSSTLYETDGFCYLFDAGAPVDALMIRSGRKFNNLKAVFITHMHDDHVGGITNLIKAIVKYPVPGQHTTIFLPETGAKEALLVWLNALHLNVSENLITFRVVRQNQVIYDDGILKVTSIPTAHIKSDNPITFAYKIECENKRILHTGDLRGDFSDFPAVCQSEYFDMCLCEATHYSPEIAVPVFMTAKLGFLWFVHIHNPWHGSEGEAKLLTYYKMLPYPVAIAHDGNEKQI